MNAKTHHLPLTLFSVLTSLSAFAGHGDIVDEIIITGSPLNTEQLTINPAETEFTTNAAELLRTVPGANLNSNGALSGIAQYRGTYGDRVSVHLDHAPALTGGPNAMDTPLSYTPTLLLKEMVVDRGLTSVSAAQESLGGHMSAQLDRGNFSTSESFDTSGALQNRYNSISDSESYAFNSVVANQHHRIALLASHDDANDAETGRGETISGTHYRRSRYDLSYGWTNHHSVIEVFAGRLDTRNSGTASLPMDINYIDTDLSGLNFSSQVGDAEISGHLAYSHVDHGMDNFSQRQAPMPAMFRFNSATAQGLSWDLTSNWLLDNGHLSLGIDSNQTRHDSVITNPNNIAFTLHNFNDAERDVYGIFSQWETQADAWTAELGLRYNRVEMSANTVSAAGLMGMMAMNANMLANQFNQSARDETFNNIDWVIKLQRALNADTQFLVELGRKNRAPSYQERYLWLPLQATGGLADGRNYIGSELNAETSHEVVLGIDWQANNFEFTPQIFYRRIDDYIQGVPATNMTANMVSTMMSGRPSLMFDNVDAELLGTDMGYSYQVSDSIQISGSLSYVRGKRRDLSDNLYRIAPLNHRVTLSYQSEQLALSLTSVLVAKQSDVAAFNEEEKTPGYGLLNIHTSYQLNQHLELQLGVNNLLDQHYQDHLAGYNRIAGGELAVGERLSGTGQNIYAGFTLNW